MKLFVITLAFVATSCSSLGTTKTCTLLGCSDAMHARIELGRTLLSVNGGRVRGCRGTTCSELTLATDVPANRVDLGSSQDGWTATREAGNDDVLVVGFGNFAPGREPTDGEVFSVEVFAPDGTAIAKRTGPVQYTVSRPNGPDCEPECRSGELK